MPSGGHDHEGEDEEHDQAEAPTLEEPVAQDAPAEAPTLEEPVPEEPFEALPEPSPADDTPVQEPVAESPSPAQEVLGPSPFVDDDPEASSEHGMDTIEDPPVDHPTSTEGVEQIPVSIEPQQEEAGDARLHSRDPADRRAALEAISAAGVDAENAPTLVGMLQDP